VEAELPRLHRDGPQGTRLRVAAKSVGRLRDKLRICSGTGAADPSDAPSKPSDPCCAAGFNTSGWRRQKGIEDLDGWLRRKLRCILGRQWKRPRTRAQKLMQRGLDEARAWASATTDTAPGECRGQPHERCLPQDLLRPARTDLSPGAAPPSKLRSMNRRIRNRTYGGVGGGSRETPSYPIGCR